MTRTTPDDWVPCPPGALVRLSAWLRFRRRLRNAATAATVLLLAGGAGWLGYVALANSASGKKECKDPEHKRVIDPLKPDGPPRR